MGARLGSAVGGRSRGGSDDLVEAHEINVTPFIDVMLVLLIIFMVAAPLATVDLGVDLPASAVEPQPRPDKPVFVTVKPDLSVAVGEDVDRARHADATLDGATNGKKDERDLPARRQGRQLWRPDGGDEPAAQCRLSQDRAGRSRRAKLITMNVFALHDVSDHAGVRRWGTSAFAIVAAHAALIVLAMNWTRSGRRRACPCR